MKIGFFLQREGNDNLVAMNDNVSFFFSNSLLKIYLKAKTVPCFFHLNYVVSKERGIAISLFYSYTVV